MRRSVSKKRLGGAKELPNPAECLENAAQSTTHCYVGAFLNPN
jgi:hypothetical protein